MCCPTEQGRDGRVVVVNDLTAPLMNGSRVPIGTHQPKLGEHLLSAERRGRSEPV
jgi:hypothetical protein